MVTSIRIALSSYSYSYLTLKPFVSLGLLDNSLTTILSEAAIQGFLTIYVFNRDEVVSLMPQPPTWRTRISLLAWPIAFDPSGMGGPTGNICYRWHGSQVHLGTQAPHCDKVEIPAGG
jgi:hypothetical protein